jgi:glyoxylase-like metal-dependent hydrolase (beta-lactamase superfamily II)
VSLLHADTGVLITGDCLFNPLGRMQWPFAAMCTSPEQNRRSARVLADRDFSLAAFTHGPEVRDRARERIRAYVTRQ